MDAIISNLLQINILILIFGFYYLLFLKESRAFQLNRFYLVICVLFSFVIPFMDFSYIDVRDTQIEVLLSQITVYVDRVEVASHDADNYWTYVLYLGMGVASLVFIWNIFSLIKLVNNGKHIKTDRYRLIVANIDGVFSFLKYIFSDSEDNEEQVIEHELIHIREKHSLDLVFYNIVQIFLWYNPMIYLLRNEVIINHEYIADRKVVSKGNKKDYINTLLCRTFCVNMNITNGLLQTNLKKRIEMMKNEKQTKMKSVKYLVALSLPILMIGISSNFNYSFASGLEQNESFTSSFEKSSQKSLINSEYSFSNMIEKKFNTIKKDVPQEEDKAYAQVEKMPSYPGGEEALYKFISKNIKYPENAAKKGISGRVFIGFIIEKDGSVSNAKVLRPVNKYLDAEALKVVNMMPKWKPGIQGEKIVRVKFTIPVSFKLRDCEKKKCAK